MTDNILVLSTCLLEREPSIPISLPFSLFVVGYLLRHVLRSIGILCNTRGK